MQFCSSTQWELSFGFYFCFSPVRKTVASKTSLCCTHFAGLDSVFHRHPFFRVFVQAPSKNLPVDLQMVEVRSLQNLNKNRKFSTRIMYLEEVQWLPVPRDGHYWFPQMKTQTEGWGNFAGATHLEGAECGFDPGLSTGKVQDCHLHSWRGWLIPKRARSCPCGSSEGKRNTLPG